MPKFIIAGPVGKSTFVALGFPGGRWQCWGSRFLGGIVYVFLKGNQTVRTFSGKAEYFGAGVCVVPSLLMSLLYTMVLLGQALDVQYLAFVTSFGAVVR